MEVHMKIIINPQLRKLRTYLNQKHIKYQDFMLNKTILKFSFLLTKFRYYERTIFFSFKCF